MGQRVLVQMTLGPSLHGAWVRVWPQYFDSDAGRHERGAGGGGIVDSSGTVRVVVRLADGAVKPTNRMGLDVMVVTGTRSTRYAEVRLERPAPVGGAMPAMANISEVIVACETGQSFAGGVPAGALASGASLVALTTPPSLIDTLSVPNDRWNNQTVAAALGADDVVRLTEPAWKGWRGGESAAILSGTPAKLQRVRDEATRAALDALRVIAEDRLTVVDDKLDVTEGRMAAFNAVTGPGRSLHLDATSVVVDDAWALTGGTHMWRRGLSFDASLAVAVFDERLTKGRPAEVVAFRKALISGRLGLAPDLLPEEPDGLVRAVGQLSLRGGGMRLSPETIDEPAAPAESDPVPETLDVDIWNPDGSPMEGFNFMTWLATQTTGLHSELESEVPGSP